MGSLPPFTTCRIGFYKTYVLALLPGSSLAGQLAASDAIPPLPAWRGGNRQPPNMSSVWFISNGSLCSLSHILTICPPFKQVSSCQNTDNSVQTARESDLVWLRHQVGANPLTRYNLEQSCKHCFGNVPLERCVMGCSKSARQLRWCNWVKTSPVDRNMIHSKLETQYSKAYLREIKYDIPAMKIILNPIIVQ